MAYRKTRKKRMARFALKLKRLHTPFVNRIAEVATREKEENVILTLNEADVRKLEECCPDLAGKLHAGMELRIDYPRLAHLDNAGHLFGIASNSEHGDDYAPLHAIDFFNIPNLIRKPKRVNLSRDGDEIRLQKRKFGAKLVLILAIDTDYDCLYFVTMFRRSRLSKHTKNSPYDAHYEKAAEDNKYSYLDSVASETKVDYR